MKRKCSKKRRGNKTTSSLAKPVIDSVNVVDNNNITFSVEIENGITKEDIIVGTCIQMEVEEL